MIEITGLSQSYHSKTILHDVELQVEKNEICALVGRNGAGKSTLIQSMLGLIPVRTGSIKLNGISHRQEGWKKHVAYLPEKFHLYPNLSGEENMAFFASLDGGNLDNARLEQKLKQVQLWEHRREQVKRYSKGMLQRLGLGIMLYYDADLLILDEPTSGLDPMGRKEILTILQGLQGKTILFSSHHMDEIRQICTHVAYLEDGRIRKYTVAEFCDEYQFGGVEG